MESVLFLSKISALITVLYAGLNIHQLTSSYNYMLEKANEFRMAIAEAGGDRRLVRLNLFVYVAIPVGYLALLRFSTFEGKFLTLLGLKFAITAGLDLWVESTLLSDREYSRIQHYCSRVDNLLNLAAAASIAHFLIFGKTFPSF